MYSKIEPKPNISNMILCCCKIKLFHLKKKPRDTFKFGSKFLYHQALKGESTSKNKYNYWNAPSHCIM